jgi:anti-sigma B factor antagonist
VADRHPPATAASLTIDAGLTAWIIFNILFLYSTGRARNMEPQMKIETRLEGNIVIIKPKGEYTVLHEQILSMHDIVKDHIEKGYKNYILSLEEVSFLDSSGIGDIFASYVSLNEAGGQLATVVTQKRIRLVFQMIKVDQVFGIFNSIEEARENLST